MSSRLIALGLVASPLAESTRPQQPINADGTRRDEPSPDEQEPRAGLSAVPEPAAFRPGPQAVPGIEVKVTVACHGHVHGHQEVTVSVRVDAFSEDDAQVSMAPSELPHVCTIAEVIALASVKAASAKIRCNGREVLPAATLASVMPSEMLRKWRSGDVAGAIPLTLHVYHAAAASTASAVRLALEINPAIGTQEAASIVRAALSSPPRAIGFRRSGPFASPARAATSPAGREADAERQRSVQRHDSATGGGSILSPARAAKALVSHAPNVTAPVSWRDAQPQSPDAATPRERRSSTSESGALRALPAEVFAIPYATSDVQTNDHLGTSQQRRRSGAHAGTSFRGTSPLGRVESAIDKYAGLLRSSSMHLKDLAVSGQFSSALGVSSSRNANLGPVAESRVASGPAEGADRVHRWVEEARAHRPASRGERESNTAASDVDSVARRRMTAVLGSPDLQSAQYTRRASVRV
jgi:hypothetical protein